MATGKASVEIGKMPGESSVRKRVFYFVPGLLGIICAVFAARFVYHTETKTFTLAYVPGISYAPTRDLPVVDDQSQPKVVLVRRSNHIECYQVLYSQKLKELLDAKKSAEIPITYRIRYKFGHPFWIETLDVAGLGLVPTISRYSVMGSTRSGDVAPQGCF